MKKAVILDFDGTLANTAHILQKIYNDMAKKRGWPNMSTEDYKRLREGTLRQAMQWSGVHSWQLPLLLWQGRKLFMKEIASVQIFTGMEELIEDLENSGWDIFVLSQNSQRAIKHVLAANNLDDNIQTLGRASVFGKHHNIRSFFKKHKYGRENVWMIGDEVRDVEAAKKAGIKIIAVSWGLQDQSVLKSFKPDILANSTDDIRKILC